MWKYKDKINKVLVILLVTFLVVQLPLRIIGSYEGYVISNPSEMMTHDELWFTIMFGYDSAFVLFVVGTILVAMYSVRKFHKLLHTESYVDHVKSTQLGKDIKNHLLHSYLISGAIFLGLSVAHFLLAGIVGDNVTNYYQISFDFVVVNILVVITSFLVTNILYLLCRLNLSFKAYLLSCGVGSVFAWFMISMLSNVVAIDSEATQMFYSNTNTQDYLFGYLHGFVLVITLYIGTLLLIRQHLTNTVGLRNSLRNIKFNRR